MRAHLVRRRVTRARAVAPALALPLVALLAAPACRVGSGHREAVENRATGGAGDDIAALEALHQAVLDAHLEGDVEAWMATEADAIVVANNGVISMPEKAARAAGRADYLGRTRFTVYRDRRDPIVQVSDDGTLGWVIAEVEMRGVQRAGDGSETPIEADWAWIELYRKQEGRWLGVGNVSNRRPPPAP